MCISPLYGYTQDQNTKTNTLQHQTKPVPQPNKTKDTKNCQQEKIRNYQQDTLKQLKDNEELFFDKCITQAKDERTTVAKVNKTNAQQIAIDKAHTVRTKLTVGMWQHGRNITYKINQLSIKH